LSLLHQAAKHLPRSRSRHAAKHLPRRRLRSALTLAPLPIRPCYPSIVYPYSNILRAILPHVLQSLSSLSGIVGLVHQSIKCLVSCTHLQNEKGFGRFVSSAIVSILRLLIKVPMFVEEKVSPSMAGERASVEAV
jgi:hypothetical protein